MQNICEINFSNCEEFIILTPEAIEKIVNKVQLIHKQYIYIELDDIMPDDYINYIINVIKTNRENSMFKYSFITGTEITKKDIKRLIIRQLGFMRANNHFCFQNIFSMETSGSLWFVLKLNLDLLSQLECEKAVAIYNRGEDD